MIGFGFRHFAGLVPAVQAIGVKSANQRESTQMVCGAENHALPAISAGTRAL
jgi:hypothetical protein